MTLKAVCKFDGSTLEVWSGFGMEAFGDGIEDSVVGASWSLLGNPECEGWHVAGGLWCWRALQLISAVGF